MKFTAKLAGFAFAFALVAGTVVTPASAQTVSELQAMIAQLQATIAAMGTGSTVAVPSFTYTRDLTLGATGSDVVALQSFLEAKGMLTIPTGVSKGYFGALTQSALAKYQASVSIAPAVGYFGPITRAKVNVDSANGTSGTTGGTTTGSTTGLQGGAGDIQNISETTSGTETTLKEGATEDVLGFDIEADDNSDLAITSIKVEITTATGESTRLNRYLDEVSIMMDGDEVGIADVSDFSRDGATSTATIALDDATVDMGEESRFYVTLTAANRIDSDELDATLNVEVTRVRFEDASGAILTEDASISTTVDFEDATADDDARIKSDSSSRDAGLLKVDENTSSDDYDLVSFQFDVDANSSDLVILEIPVELNITNGSSTGVLDVEAMIDDIYLEVDGQRYDDYDFESDVSINGGANESVTVTFTIDEGDLEIAEGDVVDAVVFVQFNEQSGNFSEGTTIAADLTGASMTAENAEGDVFVLSGTVNGEDQTLQISAATVDTFEWSVNNAGTIIDFYFTVEAIDEDFTVASSTLSDAITGTATTSAGVLSLSTGDADTVSAGNTYTVLDGDTATFRVRYAITGTVNGTYSEVKVTSVAGQELPTNKQISPTATVNLN